MILVDDQPYGQLCPPERTVRDLARDVCTQTPNHDQRMVVAIYCDGRAVGEGELNIVLDSPLSRFTQLELQTQPVAALVRTTLEQAIALLDDAVETCRATADLLDRGNNAGAMQQLQKLLEVWRPVQQSLIFSAEAMGFDLNSFDIGATRFADLVTAMKSNLADLREAMRNRDPVLIGDLLRYEMKRVLETWRTLLAGLRDSVGSDPLTVARHGFAPSATVK